MSSSALPVTEATLARILRRVDKNGPMPPNPSRPVDGPCWLWTGAKFQAGYGSVSVGNLTRLVHLVVYGALVGRIPKGMELDHVCRVRLCCNPAHLEPVTHSENIARAQGDRCKNGHLFDEANTGPGMKPTHRVCRACAREKVRRFRERRRADVA